MFGHYYEEDWGHPPWSYPPHPDTGGWGRSSRRRYHSRYPVYSRHHPGHAPWLPPGAVQMYGHHFYHEPEFRSNSANLPLPPSVEYVWQSSSRPTRRTKSSAHPRQQYKHHAHYPHHRHPPSPQFYAPPPEPALVHHSSFARRFFNDRDRERKTERAEGHHRHRHHHRDHRDAAVLIEPDVHDLSHSSLVSQLLVSRPGSARSSHPASASASRPSSRVSRDSKEAREAREAASQYRVISDLLPQSTMSIQQALLASRGHQPDQPHHASCTCYQCQGPSLPQSRSSLNSSLEHRTKQPLASLVEDLNSNLIHPGSGSPLSSLNRSSSTNKSTVAARRHLKRAATQGRLLTQAELLKLGHFRRFLAGSGLGQLDFLYRVEQSRRQREDEASGEVDENGDTADNKGSWKEESDQEFVALCALLLCGDLQLKQDTFQAITNKYEIRERLYGLVSPATDGIVTADQVIESVAITKPVRERNELAGENLRWLEKVFQRTVGDHGEISLNDFKTIVQSKNPFFVERVFQIFDKDDSGSISFQEFIDAIHQFAGQTPEDKIKFLFKVYDIDGDGLIQEAELQHVMRACMDENGMSFDEESVEELTRALYQDAASNHQPGITYVSLKSQMSKHEGLLENLTISIDRWLVPPKPKRIVQAVNDLFRVSIPREASLSYIRNNAQFILFHILFWLFNLSLFVSRLVEYSGKVNVDGSRNWSLMLARGAGQCLNFTCMFVLLPMLRLSMTKLRSKGFNYLLPLDKHTSFHRMTGQLIVVYSLLHTFAHVSNLVVNILVDPVAFLLLNNIEPPPHWHVNITHVSPVSPLQVTRVTSNVTDLVPDFTVTHASEASAWTASTWLLTSTPGLFGLVSGVANPTGVVLCIVLAVMFVCSMKWVRKSGNFEVFYWTHFLYLVFWLTLVFHAPVFWKWFIGPAILFACEKLLSVCKSRTKKGKSYVVTGVVLPSKVVNLVVKRPPNFTFKPGDYLYVNIPSIANFEWHPFTISSAPEQTDTLSLHIRAVGHWTTSLYEYFEAEQARLDGQLGASQASHKQDILRKTFTEARDRARKVSNSLGGGQMSVASSYNLWGAASGPASGGDHTRQMRQLRRADAMISVPGTGSSGDHVSVQMPGSRDPDTAETPGTNLPANAKLVARNFRYMRRKPTIMAYKPPEDVIAEEEEEDGEPDLCSSNHFILDRIAEKDSTDNLFRAGSETRTEPDTGAASTPDIRQVNNSLQVFLDGPFGAPTNLIFHAQHAVLIGTGIGVTPFASILQSIMHRYWAARNTCPKCSYRWTNDLKHEVMKLRKVDFFWINREQRSFEWFISLLSQLEIEQAEQGGAMERFLDMHMYITSALQKTDMKAVGLQLALELLHEKSKRDLITGLKTRTVAGRPNWDRVFKKLHQNRKGRVTVFFCGPPQLGKILKQKCTQFGFEYRKETF